MPRRKTRPKPEKAASPRHPWWLKGVFALVAVLGVACFLYAMQPYWAARLRGEPTGREIPLASSAIPPERVWMIPPSDAAPVPESLLSRKPVLRLRQRADGTYELLYWGNPVRPAYTYSVEAVGLGRSALVDSAGRMQDSRPLPVGTPARPDKRLPLQCILPLDGLDGGDSEFFAARISVRDAATGAILCCGDYLLSNPKAPGN